MDTDFNILIKNSHKILYFVIYSLGINNTSQRVCIDIIHSIIIKFIKSYFMKINNFFI